MDKVTDVEKALIKAIVKRYPQETPTGDRDFTQWNQDYAQAMKEVYDQFGDDIDVAVLYADSIMNLTPWQLWDLHTGEPAANARPNEAREALERAMKHKGADKHPGLLHLYIHLMEMSRTPEIAMPSADKLRGLVPDSGHLNHMSSHIDVLIGDYRRAITSNAEGVAADIKYLSAFKGFSMYAFYLLHNYQSLIYAAMFAGQAAVALENCEHMEKIITREALSRESPPMADWIESFVSVRAHVLIRFGRWDDILDMSLPEDQALYSYTTATLHYARGIAWAAKGEVAKAEKEQSLFLEAQARVPPTRLNFPNKAADVFNVAEAMLAGELEYRRGNIDKAFEHLRRAIDLDDHLVYGEPWGWMVPTRHSYAALLLEQNRVEEAAQAYAEDLGFDTSLPRGHQHPNNIWALQGYYECLKKLGRTEELKYLELPLKLAVHIADTSITTSCFCRGAGKDTKKEKRSSFSKKLYIH